MDVWWITVDNKEDEQEQEETGRWLAEEKHERVEEKERWLAELKKMNMSRKWQNVVEVFELIRGGEKERKRHLEEYMYSGEAMNGLARFQLLSSETQILLHEQKQLNRHLLDMKLALLWEHLDINQVSTIPLRRSLSSKMPCFVFETTEAATDEWLKRMIQTNGTGITTTIDFPNDVNHEEGINQDKERRKREIIERIQEKKLKLKMMKEENDQLENEVKKSFEMFLAMMMHGIPTGIDRPIERRRFKASA